MKKGRVTLVGAGPGPGMITVRGLEKIKNAEVILYDALIDDDILGEAPSGCELIAVGKRHGLHSMKEDEIIALMIKKAEEGLNVIRLKGGDNFVFGRGSEEVTALAEKGIPYELVPGVTSISAIPESFGIPVTHRGLAGSFAVVTGHSASRNRPDYETLASFRGTLIFLMGIHYLKEIADGLIGAGKDPGTPAAVLVKGMMDGAYRIDGILGNIAESAKDAQTPGIIVIGDVAALHLENTAPFAAERRVFAVGSEDLILRLKRAAEKRPLPKIHGITVLETRRNEDALSGDLNDHGWIVFTSRSGVSAFFEALYEKGMDVRDLAGIKFACVGCGSAERLKEYGVIADLVPEKQSAEGLSEVLTDEIRGNGSKVLIVKAEGGTDTLEKELSSKGIEYKDCIAYSTVPVIPQDIGISGKDIIIISSAKAGKVFFEQCSVPDSVIAVCMGNTAAKYVREHCEAGIVLPEKKGIEGVLAAVESILNREETI